MSAKRKPLLCGRCGRRVSLRRRGGRPSAWPSPAGVICFGCRERPTFEEQDAARLMLKCLGLPAAEDAHARSVGESLVLEAQWAWQDGGDRIGRPLDPRFVPAALRYALAIAEATCGPATRRSGGASASST